MLIVTSIERATTLSYFVKFFFRVILKDKKQKENIMYYCTNYNRWVGKGTSADRIEDCLYRALEGVDADKDNPMVAPEYTRQELHHAINLFKEYRKSLKYPHILKEGKMQTSKSVHIKNFNAEDDKYIEEQNEFIEERIRCLLDGLITKKEVMYDITDSFFKILARGANKS